MTDDCGVLGTKFVFSFAFVEGHKGMWKGGFPGNSIRVLAFGSVLSYFLAVLGARLLDASIAILQEWIYVLIFLRHALLDLASMVLLAAWLYVRPLLNLFFLMPTRARRNDDFPVHGSRETLVLYQYALSNTGFPC